MSLIYKKLKDHQTLFMIIFFLLLSFMYILPFFPWRELPFTFRQDGRFHLSRIEELYKQLKDGPLLTYISLHSFSEIGYGLNFFYPFITLLPAALFRLIFENPFYSHYMFIFFYTFITFCLSYFCMRDFSNSNRQSIIFAIMYGFSGFRAIDWFSRSAIGEAIAITFLPLVFLGFYHVVAGNYSKWYLLSIGMTLLVYTHVLSVLMTVLIMLALFLVFYPFSNEKWTRLKKLLLSVLLTILLSLNVLVPFIDQYFNIELIGTMPVDISEKAYPLLGQLQYSFFGTYIPGGASYNMGTIVLVVTLLCLIGFFLVSSKYRISLIIGILILFMATDIFPWDKFVDSPLSIIQFPWRFFAFVTLFFCVYSSGVLDRYLKLISWRSKGSVVFILLFTLGSFCVHFYHSKELENENIQLKDEDRFYQLDNETYPIITKTYLNADYLPTKSEEKFSTIYKDRVFADGEKLSDVNKKINKRSYQYEFSLKQDSKVDLPILAYKNMWVYDNGKQIPLEISKRGTVLITLAAGRHRVSVGNSVTLLYKAAWGISSIMWLSLLFVGIKKKYR